MIPDFRGRNLPPGVHQATWDEFVLKFGTTPRRLDLIAGLQLGIEHLRSVGCQRVFVDGSFVTRKEVPQDFDCCWDRTGVNTPRLEREHPVFFNFRNERLAQKVIYKGEFFPTDYPADARRTPYLLFFQRDRKTGKPKGIILLNTGEVP